MAETDNDVVQSFVDDTKLKLPDVKIEGDAVSSGDENFKELLKERSKVYRFVDGAWKERGVGDIRLLKEIAGNRVFCVLRQEKTYKVRVNFMVDPDIPLEPHGSSDTSFVVSAQDFSEGVPEVQTFAIRFRNAETAGNFKRLFDEARENNKGSAPVVQEEKKEEGPVGNRITADVKSVAEVYEPLGKDVEAAERFKALGDAFVAKFGVMPTFYVRAPGRVNLIGEHIDYHGYSVLPMAVAQDIVIAVAVGDEVKSTDVTFANVLESFKDGSVPLDPSAAVADAKENWHAYAHCGYKAAFAAAAEVNKDATVTPTPFVAMVDGSIPRGAGLSSSSALVVAAALATATANGMKDVTDLVIAEQCRLAEYHIGTMGGGMDQAISLLARPGEAARIDFNPLRYNPVALPPNTAVVVANSTKEASKAALAGYNIRVTEGKLGAKIIARNEGVDAWRKIKTVKDLQTALKLEVVTDILPLADKHLRSGEYSFDDFFADESLGCDPTTVFEGDIKKEGAVKVLQSGTALKLLPRVKHIVNEAARVEKFYSICQGEASDSTLSELGDILNAGQASLAGDYECSGPELDELAAAMREAGAAGARLTGAGWGGCCVALVKAGEEEEFIAKVKNTYYTAKGIDNTGSLIFATRPSGGACVLSM